MDPVNETKQSAGCWSFLSLLSERISGYWNRKRPSPLPEGPTSPVPEGKGSESPLTDSKSPSTAPGSPTTASVSTTTAPGSPTTASVSPTTAPGSPTTASVSPTTAPGSPTTASESTTTAPGSPTTKTPKPAKRVATFFSDGASRQPTMVRIKTWSAEKVGSKWGQNHKEKKNPIPRVEQIIKNRYLDMAKLEALALKEFPERSYWSIEIEDGKVKWEGPRLLREEEIESVLQRF